MSIYTKTGDKGETGLFSGKRIPKDDILTETLGNFDEANSWLGIIGGLEEIQKDLMTICSILAGAKLEFPDSKTEDLEIKIDVLEKELPPLDHFILPKGKLMYGRALVRRAERSLVRVSRFKKVRPEVLSYVNRLSDYLFMLSRKANSH
ncbi:MAG: cob(I)yrinic acid a,c-diamide adenosyltransferase [Candidatus Microgenomates bacterium]|jgi:cob(I)alamin adenosyltransferase